MFELKQKKKHSFVICNTSLIVVLPALPFLKAQLNKLKTTKIKISKCNTLKQILSKPLTVRNFIWKQIENFFFKTFSNNWNFVFICLGNDFKFQKIQNVKNCDIKGFFLLKNLNWNKKKKLEKYFKERKKP